MSDTSGPASLPRRVATSDADGVDSAARAPFMRRVTTDQPLSSVEAFALALVEASSRLTPPFVTPAADAPLVAPLDDAVAAD